MQPGRIRDGNGCRATCGEVVESRCARAARGAAGEYAYDRDTKVGHLSQGLDLAPKLGWHLINMKNDWKVIFPFELK